MGIIKSLYGKKIFLDTAPLIYYIEDSNVHVQKLTELFDVKSRCRFVTSVITLTEVLVMPLRLQNTVLARQYENILTDTGNVDIYEINLQIAKQTAQLRATYNVKTPDALQLATAQYCSADYFLTNDLKLKAVNILNVITLDEL
jgi:predicted nucleic acid-binding protein